ncbi:DEAD/DEAH box helicase [Paenibacillus taichungensis]
MPSSFFFEQLDSETLGNPKVPLILKELEKYSEEQKRQVYVIDRPISERKYKYVFKEALIVLIPSVKILILNFGAESEAFEDYVDDFVEDLGYISDKYDYKSFLGRPKKWRDDLIQADSNFSGDISSIIRENSLSGLDSRKAELLVSLLTGSINDIERVQGDVPDSSLEQVKKNIVLFDGEQTRFIFKTQDKKRITIQGLAGTGKTELLLHKLKDIYVNEEDSKIFFTCFNKILSKNLKERIPDFFDFMKVGEQIKWHERLWVERSWGSQLDKNSGLYSFVCNHYQIPFQRYSWATSFEYVCKQALIRLEEMENEGNFSPYFDYILIDESQDFNEAFFKLCEKISKKQVYIAGDIFQSIYDYTQITENTPDFLLNRVYRTDPKTLMFAHALGFGLVERPVVRWLDDEEWLACGYNLKIEGDKYSFSREPLRRFENITDDITSIKLSIAKDESYLQNVISTIDHIIGENPTVEPGDIGIVFLENSNQNYNLVEQLIIKIDAKFGWSSVKGYELKNKKKDTLFISNRNNIKGLEFPFIICITTTPLNTNTTVRNSLYMMLTRSFITSYLILSEDNGDLNLRLEQAASEIIDTGVLTVKKPNSDEIMDTTKLRLESQGHKSQYDIVEEILQEFDIVDILIKEKIHRLVNVMLKDSVDVEKIYAIISKNIDFI